MRVHVREHALERWRERVGPGTDAELTAKMLAIVKDGPAFSDKHRRRTGHSLYIADKETGVILAVAIGPDGHFWVATTLTVSAWKEEHTACARAVQWLRAVAS